MLQRPSRYIGTNLCNKLIFFLCFIVFFYSQIYSQTDIRALERKLSYSKKGTVAEYIYYAKSKINQNTIDGRARAASMLEKGMKEYPGNSDLVFLYARLLRKQGFISRSENYLIKVTELEPDLGEAWFLLGEIYLNKMQKYKDQVSGSSTRLNYMDYALEYYDKSRIALQRSLDCGFVSDSLYHALFWMYYDTENYGAAMKVLEDAPTDNWRFQRLLGLACYKHGDFEQSDRYISNALELMPQQERMVYENAADFFEEDHFTASLVSSDPFLLTIENERYLEHLARITYAQEKFTVEKLFVEGWRSDRGKTLIRFGFPLQTYKIRPEIDNSDIYLPTLVWIYDDFQIHFVAEFLGEDYRFAEPDFTGLSSFKTRSMVNYAMFSEDLFNARAEIYDFSKIADFQKIDLEMLDSRETDNTDKVSLVWTNRHEKERNWEYCLFQETDGKMVPVKYFRTDEIYEVWHTDTLVFNKNMVNIETDDNRFFSGVFEGYDRENRRYIRKEIEKEFVIFNRESLFVSDIEFAYMARDKRYSGELIKTPSHVYREYQPVAVEFTISNIKLSEVMENELHIEYKISPVESNRFWDRFLSVFEPEQVVNQSIAIENVYPVQSGTEKIRYILNISNLPPGQYYFEINVTNPNSNESYARRSKFVKMHE